ANSGTKNRLEIIVRSVPLEISMSPALVSSLQFSCLFRDAAAGEHADNDADDAFDIVDIVFGHVNVSGRIDEVEELPGASRGDDAVDDRDVVLVSLIKDARGDHFGEALPDAGGDIVVFHLNNREYGCFDPHLLG